MMYGPLVLAGLLGDKELTNRDTYLGYKTTPGGFPVSAPEIQTVLSDPIRWVEPVRSQALTFQTAVQSRLIPMVPLYKVYGQRYVVYWKANAFPA